MLERVKSYFRHYRSERRGVIVLASIILLAIVGVEVFRILYEPKVERIDVLLITDENTAKKNDSQASNESKIERFAFNPNTLNDSGYALLGFSDKEIKTLRKYQAAGASFEIKKDFAKLFFVDEEEYAALETYIDLPESKPRPKKEFSKSFDKYPTESRIKWSDTASTEEYYYKEFSCNLNTADTNELKKLNGIGSFYAKKIIEYREELGGFHNLGQLKEIWKMSDEKIDKFAAQVVIDLSEIRQIDLSRATAHELSQHPYVSFGEASKIVLQREELGKITDSKAFCSSGLLDADLCRKLVPYLYFAE